MASLSNINGIFDVHSTGAILFSTSHGTSGQILKSNGNAAPTWIPQSDIVGAYLPLAGGTLTGATATASGISFTVGGALTGTTAGFSGSVIASGNSNSFGNTTIAALSASTGTFSASVTAAGNSNSFGTTTFSGTVTSSNFSGPGQGLDNLLPLSVYSTTPGTAGVLIATNIVSNNYGFLFGTIKLEQFNQTSKQTIEFSATVTSTGTVYTKAATADVAITIKLFHVGGYWYIHLPMPSTYVTVSAYIYTGAGYQGQAKGFNEISSITINAVPSGATSSVDIVASVYSTTAGSSPWTTSGNDIYNNNSGSVGINNTSPSSHYSNYNQLVVGNGTGNQGMTIFAGSNDESSINFTDTTNTFSNNFVIKVDHNDSSESNNPSFQINYENNRYVTINRQTTGSSQVPQVRLGMFNSSSLPANLDHSMLEIGLNSGMNNPGMVMYGDSQGNSNPFIGMVSTSGSSQITTKFFRFYHNTTLCGTIQKRYNANEVQYLTTSDYRLKKDLKSFKALDTICKINVYNYKWNNIKEDNVNYGVLAHELQELIPEVVAGEKDEVNEKGEKEYQAVDYSKLVPHLIQSIQELEARVKELENK